MSDEDRKVMEKALTTFQMLQAANIWNDPLIDALRARLSAPAQEARPIGKIIAGTGSLNDLAMIQWTDDYRPKVGDLIFASPPARQESAALSIVLEQAEDEGLWCQAQTAMENYLQKELRRLHAAIERKVRGS